MKRFLQYILLTILFQIFIGCGGSSSDSSSTPVNKIKLTLIKSTYFEDENITLLFKDVTKEKNNWIAIYPKGSENSYKNILRREDINGTIQNGKISFEGLAEGKYEIRAFWEDSLEPKASVLFEVILPYTIYEDAEDNISSNWVQVLGHYKPIRVENGYKSKGALVLTPEWISNVSNIAEYHLDMNNSTQKILEMDMGGLSTYRLPNLPNVGYIQHYKVGVYVQILNGRRAMTWDSFFNHGHVEPFSDDYGNGNIWLSYPSPVEHVRGYDVGLAIDKWVHFRVNVEKELQKLEPENRVLSINTFLATGGFIDNLKLSSY